MEAVGGLLTGFGVILTLDNLFVCFLGSLIGTLVGVLPGVGPLAALALLLPITFTMTPVGGMVMLASIFYGAMYGGSTTSILLNIPGEAASVVTCLDGHQMAKQGRAGAALGIAAIGSFVAGTLGVIVMTFFAPTIATVAIRFGPPENFALMVLGIVCTLFMITGPPVKGALMAHCRGRYRRRQRPRALYLRVDRSFRRHRASGRRHRAVRSDGGVEQRREGRQKHPRRRAHPRLVANGGGLEGLVAAHASRQRIGIPLGSGPRGRAGDRVVHVLRPGETVVRTSRWLW